MATVVIYDSFVHGTPLYYILFMLFGAMVGNVFYLAYQVQFQPGGKSLALMSNGWSVLFLIVLVVLRFYLAEKILKTLHVVWISDATLLFFIGVYRTKWKVVITQTDEIYYRMLSKRN